MFHPRGGEMGRQKHWELSRIRARDQLGKTPITNIVFPRLTVFIFASCRMVSSAGTYHYYPWHRYGSGQVYSTKWMIPIVLIGHKRRCTFYWSLWPVKAESLGQLLKVLGYIKRETYASLSVRKRSRIARSSRTNLLRSWTSFKIWPGYGKKQPM